MILPLSCVSATPLARMCAPETQLASARREKRPPERFLPPDRCGRRTRPALDQLARSLLQQAQVPQVSDVLVDELCGKVWDVDPRRSRRRAEFIGRQAGLRDGCLGM